MYDIVYIGAESERYRLLKQKYTTLKRADNISVARRICMTKMFWVVWPDVDVCDDFKFDYRADEWSQEVVHVFKNADIFDGIILVPKSVTITEEEIEHRIFSKKKEVNIIASTPSPFDVFEIDSYDEYLYALENSSTEMFWMTSNNLKIDKSLVNSFYISCHDIVDRKQNHAFIHRVDNTDYYNGVFLCSKHIPLSKREVEYRFPVNKKEWNIVASGPVQYNIFEIDSYDDYLSALENSFTEMFWIIPSDIILCSDFKFDMYFAHHDTYNRNINHVFKNGKYHDGVILASKNQKISEREFMFRFLAKKKEHDIVASVPAPYDVVFISYQEPNADENYELLKQKVPSAKRVHGVKGIHQAHIAAAKQCTTPMFYIVDGDAIVMDDFEFDHQVAAWQYDHVFVWRSQNPINDMVYGYGGLKLFPRQLTLDMDTSRPDMTTSISKKFNAMPAIANITAFNTGAFETWKSAFRECAKLSSKVIDRQKDDETNARLETWTTIGHDRPFGKYAIQGAKAGMQFGQSKDVDLRLINDFEWLKEQFDANI